MKFLSSINGAEDITESATYTVNEVFEAHVIYQGSAIPC